MPDEEDLLDRIIQLRGALHGLTADNAELRRELARIRRENGSLRDALDRSRNRSRSRAGDDPEGPIPLRDVDEARAPGAGRLRTG